MAGSMETAPPVIALDGPAAVGKGTVARLVAAELGFTHLDSGRYYRVAGSAALAAGAALEDPAAVVGALAPVLADPDALAAALADPGLGDERIGQAASVVARLPDVRAALLGPLRATRRLPGLVADGRDIATVVFPDAAPKLYLDASPATRAARAAGRAGGFGATMNDSLGEFHARDARDSRRCVAPVRPAPDAVVIATDTLDAATVAAEVVRRYRTVTPGTQLPEED